MGLVSGGRGGGGYTPKAPLRLGFGEQLESIADLMENYHRLPCGCLLLGQKTIYSGQAMVVWGRDLSQNILRAINTFGLL